MWFTVNFGSHVSELWNLSGSNWDASSQCKKSTKEVTYSVALVLASQGCYNKVSLTAQLNSIYSLTVWEVRSPKLRCQQGHAPFVGFREKFSPWCLLAIFDISWFVAISFQFLLPPSHGLLPSVSSVSVSLCTSFPLEGHQSLDLGPSLIHYYLILIIPA